MKRKFILIITSIVSISLFVLLISSSLIVLNINQKNIEQNITRYLTIVERNFTGDNFSEASSILTKADSNIRVTFIDDDGIVLYDSRLISDENHLLRPEIQSLGKVFTRYSNTIDARMVYIASYQNNCYIRVAIVSSSINNIVNSLLLYGIITLVVICVVLIFIENKYYSSFVKPIQNEIKKLNSIVDDDSIIGDDFLVLSHQIDTVCRLINEKIDDLGEETSKLNYIMETMNQGLIIVDGKGKIILSNKKALNIVECKTNYLYKDISFIIREHSVLEQISLAMGNEVNNVVNTDNKGKFYQYSILSLKNSFASVEDSNGVAVFIEDITERVKLDKMKYDFFNNASHELKSPLTTILGYQQMIEEGIIIEKQDLFDATHKTILEINRIKQIVGEMLDLSRLESKIDKGKEKINVVTVIDNILEYYKPVILNKSLSIEINVNDLYVFMNADDLNHLLRNVIDNAIKYNNDNGVLGISVSGNVLTIKDTGIGIDNKNIDRIFERFYRVDKAHSKEMGGTGLGLAIVKHVCINYDIKISVKSKLGSGTKFVMDFTNCK